MAKSVFELAVGTGQWDAGLKKAKSALDNFTQSQGRDSVGSLQDSEKYAEVCSHDGTDGLYVKDCQGSDE